MKEKGFSLVQVLLALGMAGGLSLFLMRLSTNSTSIQSKARSNAELQELKSSIRMILDNEKFCRISLAGNGDYGNPSNPVRFYKKNVDNIDTEGLDVSLYYSNPDGNLRTTKKFNGSNNPGSQNMSQFGNITIKSMKLVFNNLSGINYSNSATAINDAAVLKVIIEKKVGSKKARNETHYFDLNVEILTGQSPESSGQSRILSCSKTTQSGSGEVTSEEREINFTITSRDYSGDNESCVVRFDIGGICSVSINSASSYGNPPSEWDDTDCYNWAHGKIIDGRHSKIRCDKNELVFYGTRLSNTKNRAKFLILQ